MTTGTSLHATIGRYHLTEFVGAGGMGEVYRAVDQGSGASVAVKLLTGARDSTALRARFRNEARIHATLRHPNIARMLEHLEHDGVPAIVMEYVDGETLEDRIARDGAIALPEAVAHAIALVDAVAHLHRRAIVHRDIKSTNVKVTSRGVVKLLDFGIAKGPDSPALTADGSVVGTLQSLAPEQLLGAPADLQTEVWAMGVLLYEMLTGQHPFARLRRASSGAHSSGANDSTAALTARIRSGRYVAATQVLPTLPRAVDAVIARCLSVDPQHRYPSCEALRTELESVRQSGPTTSDAAFSGRKLVAPLRGRAPLLLSIVAATAALVFLAVQLGRGPAHPTAPTNDGVSARESALVNAPDSVGELLPGNTPARPLRNVTVNTLNGRAEVWAGGSLVGSTPYVLRLQLGAEVDLELRRAGYRSEPVRFTVTEGRSEYNFLMRAAPSSYSPVSDFTPFVLAMGWFSLPWRRRKTAASDALLTVDRPIPSHAGQSAESRVIVGTASDPGCVRDNNEDTVRVVRAPGTDTDTAGLLAMVCDGMGGHVGGETASRLAAEVISRVFLEHVSTCRRPRASNGGAAADPGAALATALMQANREIYSTARADTALRGMGTTCTALVLMEGLAWCAHVGDSRCYLLRNEEIFAMTEDHSAVMALVRVGEISRSEAREHPDRNVISRALGSHANVDVTTWPRPFVIRPGDRFLLCTDGLHDVLTEEEIRTVACAGSPDSACRDLVARTRDAGAPDNVSVLLLAVPAAEPSSITRSVEMPS